MVCRVERASTGLSIWLPQVQFLPGQPYHPHSRYSRSVLPEKRHRHCLCRHQSRIRQYHPGHSCPEAERDLPPPKCLQIYRESNKRKKSAVCRGRDPFRPDDIPQRYTINSEPHPLNIYLRDLCRSLTQRVNLLQFADDIVIYAEAPDCPQALSHIECALEEASIFLNNFGLDVSSQKSKAVIFSRKKLNPLYLSQFPLRLGGSNINIPISYNQIPWYHSGFPSYRQHSLRSNSRSCTKSNASHFLPDRDMMGLPPTHALNPLPISP